MIGWHRKGFKVSQATVSRYMPRRTKPPSSTWRSFLRNHTVDLVSIDLFVVPTATFRVLYVFLLLEHERRNHGCEGVSLSYARCATAGCMARMAAALRAFGNAGESSNSLGLLTFADMAPVTVRRMTL